VAGLVNAARGIGAFVQLAASGQWEEATALYHWFLPLVRMDPLPKFVRLIKLVQAEDERLQTARRSLV